MVNLPVLSIIIVSYNTSQLVLDCLKSIFADKNLDFNLSSTDSSSKIPAEIIIVDNNSSDQTVSQLKKLKQPLKIIENHQNYGFGKANNQGAKAAKGNYLLLLNSDTIILHSAISQTLDWLSSHPESYACTAQLLNQDKTIQPSGGYFPNLLNTAAWCLGLDDLPLVNHLIKPIHPHSPQFYTHDRYYLHDHPQDWITGAFMMIRKNFFEEVGGFDENYFMYGEELELCFRIHRRFPKSQLWYLVGPQIIHLGGSSAKNRQSIYQLEHQGIFHFFEKHYGSPKKQIVAILININRLLHSTIYKLFSHA